MPKGYLFLLVSLLTLCSPVARADKLTITSTRRREQRSRLMA